MPRRGNTLKITWSDRGNEFTACLFSQRRLITYKNNMTITIRELLEHLKHYPLETAVVIEDVDDAEFAIVDFVHSENVLTIKIGEKAYQEEGE
ncbi:MAG: hypothetical protein ACYT04_94090, partial [Nostoc sp.]